MDHPRHRKTVQQPPEDSPSDEKPFFQGLVEALIVSIGAAVVLYGLLLAAHLSDRL